MTNVWIFKAEFDEFKSLRFRSKELYESCRARNLGLGALRRSVRHLEAALDPGAKKQLR